MLHPDGSFMCHTSWDRTQWYLDRNLADLIQGEPCIIQLKFKPAGRGHHGVPYYYQGMKNICVVCGTKKNLTTHHVVPSNFRKFMPAEIKSRNHHDILPVCVPCHNAYEPGAYSLKKKLSAEYGIPIHGINDINEPNITVKARKAAGTILKHGQRIPDKPLLDLTLTYVKVFGLDFSLDALREARIPISKRRPANFKKAGEALLDFMEIDEIIAFVKMWRCHFLTWAKKHESYPRWRRELNLNPKNFPKHWRVDHVVWSDDYGRDRIIAK